MKKFNKLSMVLFDSTSASFKLSVESTFTKTNQIGGFTPLVYTTQAGTGNLNPNIYLLFQYKSDTYDKGNVLYTSYPQLYRIREAMESIKALVADNSGFTTDTAGNIIVKQEYVEPVVVANIGKQNKWLSFKLVIFNTTEEGVTKSVPGVSIEISSANGYASALTIEEFLTVYTIVKDIDLATLQCQMSLAFLATDDGMAAAYVPAPGAYQPAPQQYAQYQRPQYQQPAGAQPTPRYNNPQRPAPASRVATSQPQQVRTGQSQSLPPRAEKPVMTLGAVEETPVSEVSFDDTEAIDDIFGDNE